MIRALLRGEWIHTNAQVGDILNLIGEIQSLMDVEFDLETDGKVESKPKVNGSSSSVDKSNDNFNQGPSKGGTEDDLWASMDFQEDSALNDISLSQGLKPGQKANVKEESKEEEQLWEGLDTADVDFQGISSQPSSSQPSRIKANPRITIESEDQSSTSTPLKLVSIPTLILSVSKEHSENLLILHPDVLIPATKLSDVASCMRRPLIQDRMRGAGSEDVGVGLVMGNLAHEVLQACLLGKGAEVTDQDRLLGGSTKVEKEDSSKMDQDEDDEFESQWWSSQGEESSKCQDELNFPAEWSKSSSIGDFSLPFVRAQVRFQIKKNLASLISCGLTDTSSAVNLLMDTIKGYGWFAKLYLDGKVDSKEQDGRAKTEMQVDGDVVDREPFETEISVSGKHQTVRFRSRSSAIPTNAPIFSDISLLLPNRKKRQSKTHELRFQQGSDFEESWM